MTLVKTMNDNEGNESAFWIRLILPIAAVVYAGWSLVYQFVLPNVDDPLRERLLVSAFSLAIVAISFVKKLQKTLLFLLLVAGMFGMWQLLWLSHRNAFNPYYQLGCLTLLACTLPTFLNPYYLAAYMSFCTSMLLYFGQFHSFKQLLILYAAWGSISFVTTVYLFARLVLMKKLKKSQEQTAREADNVDRINRDISAIMANIQQGIFTIESSTGQMGKQASHFLATNFAVNLDHSRRFLDIFAQSDLSSDQKSQMQGVVSSIGEPPLEFDLNRHLLPTSCVMRTATAERIIEMDWNPIFSGNQQQLEKILVSMRDVTDLKNLVAASKTRDQQLLDLSEVIMIPDKKMESLYASLRKLHHSAKAVIDENRELNPGHLSKIFRDVHTIKGLARSYHLSSLADAAHISEDAISRHKLVNRTASSAEASAFIEPLTRSLEKYADLLFNKLGRSPRESQSIRIPREELLHQLQTVNQHATDKGLAAPIVGQLQTFFVTYTRYPLAQVIGDLLTGLSDLASELEKPTPLVTIDDPGYSIAPASHDMIKGVFTHLLRNSIDHGIEPPNERLLKGKAREGEIFIKLTHKDDCLHIIMRDDGAGLNLHKIRDRAIKYGIIIPDQNLTTTALVQLIFYPDFSTKDKVTSISGRGVGLDAVKSYLDSFNCGIALELLDAGEVFAHFQYVITLYKGLYDTVIGQVSVAAKGGMVLQTSA